jgi:hypothetical protein
MVERTRRLVGNLADTKYCVAGDTWLAKKLGCSTRSVQRYLKELESTGQLVRTAVHMKNRGSWKSKRAMKPKLPGVAAFGVPRDNVISMRRGIPKPAPKNTQNPRLDPHYMGEVVDGFGRPFHEDIKSDPHQRQVVHLPESLLQTHQEALRRAQAARPPVDPELNRLRCAYVIASVHRATRRTS